MLCYAGAATAVTWLDAHGAVSVSPTGVAVLVGNTNGTDGVCSSADQQLPAWLLVAGVTRLASGNVVGSAGVVDVVALTASNGSVSLLANDGNEVFADVSGRVALPPGATGFTTVAVMDGDADGVVDVWLGAVSGVSSVLLLGGTGVFTPTTDAVTTATLSGIVGDVVQTVPVDVDRDGASAAVQCCGQ